MGEYYAFEIHIIHYKMRRKTFLLSAFFILQACLFSFLQAQTTRYVASGMSSSGSSWADASGDLQAMIEASAEGDIILIKEGLYKPASEVPNLVTVGGSFSAAQRAYKLRAFYLKKGVKIYGGCKGTESTPADRPANFDPTGTILSGSDTALATASEPNSRSTDGTHSERCAYHVIIGLGDMSGTVLDGFTIQNGKSYRGSNNKTARDVINDRNGIPYDVYYLSGGGLHLSNTPNTGSTPQPTSITLNNLMIRNCNSIGETTYTPTSISAEPSKGSGLYADNINITFENLSVEGCVARSGGGIYVVNASHLTGTNLSCYGNNSATGYGNAVFIENVEAVTLTEVTLDSNIVSGTTSGGTGGGMYNKDIITLTLNGNISITNNKVNANAGGIYNENIGTFHVPDNLTISNNEAATSGDGMYNYNVDIITIPNLTLTGNTSKGGHGGGMYIEKTSTLSPFTDLTVTGNSAFLYGGGIYLNGIWKKTNFVAENFICSNNTTRNHGGGMYTHSIDVFKIRNLTLDGNSTTASGGNGGGIYTNGPVTVPSRALKNNDLTSHDEESYAADLLDDYISLLEITNLVSCKNNTAYTYGGAFYTQYVKNFEFVNNVIEGSISGNKASNGDGGVFYNNEIISFKTGALVAGGGNSAGNNGGVIYTNYVHIEIPVIEIGDGINVNTANSNGGGIYFTNSTWNDFERLVLKKNTATRTNGGGLYLNGKNWTQNLTVNTLILDGNTAGTCGGGMYTTAIDQIKIENLTLTNNSTTSNTSTSHGGGIHTAGISSRRVGLLSINKVVECSNNTATANGGAFYNQYIDKIEFGFRNDFLMAGNKAYNGGAMYNDNVTSLVLPMNSSFEGNSTTSQDGGALYNKDMPEFFAEHITFKNNTSQRHGGAMYNTGITNGILINHAEMHNNKTNTSSGNGGAIHCTSLSKGMIINSFDASGNTSGYAGGTFYFNSNAAGSVFNLRNGKIANSTSYNHGGGIYINGSAENDLIVYNVTFDTCTATHSGTACGSAIWIATGTKYFNVYLTDIQVRNCYAGFDGTIYLGEGTKKFVITTDQFEYNIIEKNGTRRNTPGIWTRTVKDMVIENTIIQDNLGGNVTGNYNGETSTGGAFYFTSSSGIVRNCKILRNHIHDGGSGAYSTASQISYSNVLFEGNRAETSGTLYCDGGSSTTVLTESASANLIMRNNSAKNGGAIYNTNATLTLVNALITGNSADENGGAIHNDNNRSKMFFYNVAFTGNKCGNRGAVLYTGSLASNNIWINVLFSGNISEKQNGVTYSSGSTGNYYANCTFADNYAKSTDSGANAGALYGTASKHYLYNCIFYNNKRASSSGDVISDYKEDGNNIYLYNTWTTEYDGSSNKSTVGLTGDPEFVGALSYDSSFNPSTSLPSAAGNYRLRKQESQSQPGQIEYSPAIDAGINQYYYEYYTPNFASLIGEFDLDMTEQIKNGTIDLGAYEGGYGSPWEPGDANLWYGSTDPDNGTAWNIASNWLNNRVPQNGEPIGFHQDAINHLVVPDNYFYGSGPVRVSDIYNVFSSKNLILNSQELHVEGKMNFNPTVNKMDARKSWSHLFLETTTPGVNQDLIAGLFEDNAIFDLTVDKPDDVKVEGNYRFMNEVTVKNTGKLDATAETATIIYGYYPEPASPDEYDSLYRLYAGTVDPESPQEITDDQYKDNIIYSLIIDNAEGVHIKAEQTDTDNPVLRIPTDLFINANKKMIVEPAAGVIVEDKVHNYAGTDGLLIRTGTGTENGKLVQTAPTGTFKFFNNENYPVEGSVEFFQKAYYDSKGEENFKYKWQYITMPVREVAAVPTFRNNALRKWNERQDHADGTPYWEDITTSDILYSFQGYEITALNPMLITIQGILENRDYKNVLTYTPYDPANHEGWHNGEITDQDPHEGEHIIGNPYTTSIEIGEMAFGTNIEKTVYIFNTGSFMDWHNEGRGSGGYNYLDNLGQYIVIPQHQAGKQVAGDDGVTLVTLPSQIPPMQGFSVMRQDATGTDADNTFTLTYSSKEVGDKNETHVRSVDRDNKEVYTFISMESEHCQDFVWISIRPDCRKGFDNGWDGRKIVGMSAAAQVFTMEGEEDELFQISVMDDLNDTYLGFRATEKDTEYKLTFTHKNLQSEYKQLKLIDLLGNKTVDVTESGSTYTFTANNATDIRKRFRLEATPATSSLPDDNKINNKDQVIIYSNQNDLIIKHKELDSGTIYVYDTTGRLLLTNKVATGGETIIHMDAVLKGVYIVKILSNNKEITKSIIL